LCAANRSAIITSDLDRTISRRAHEPTGFDNLTPGIYRGNPIAPRFEKAVLTPDTIAAVGRLHLENTPLLSAVTAGLSNLVSNVPAVLVLKPFIADLHDPQRAWLTVAMASTLAGNFTLVGSVANLIVVQRARADGVNIGFWAYFKVGAPLTVLTILIGVVWLHAFE